MHDRELIELIEQLKKEVYDMGVLTEAALAAQATAISDLATQVAANGTVISTLTASDTDAADAATVTAQTATIVAQTTALAGQDPAPAAAEAAATPAAVPEAAPAAVPAGTDPAGNALV